MWKRLATVIMVLALFSLFTITPAQAGDKQRYMWYGAGIAVGSVALLGLLTHPHMAPSPPPRVVYSPPPPQHYYYPPPPSPSPDYVPGRWETTREWVPGTWERVWVPGHYDPWRNWWRNIMRIAKLLDIMWSKGSGSGGIAWITKDSLIKKRELRDLGRPRTLIRLL